jgi:iron complex transport system substrate-binding protein
MRANLFLLTILILFASCDNKPNHTNGSINALQVNPEIKYAKGFKIEYGKGYKLISVFNPWEGAENIVYKYLLVEKGAQTPKNIKGALVIPLPVKRIICLSSTYIAMLDFIHQTKSIVGVSGANYINNGDVVKRIKKNEIADVGYDQGLNYELIVGLKPDIVMAYGVGSEMSNHYNKLKELGINVVFNAEYLEGTPLAKTEWVKFMAAFFNEENIANLKFDSIANEYNSLAKLAAKSTSKPKILCGLPWKDSWFIPGGNSYIGKMIEDAGGTYLWKDDQQRGSFPLGFEAIFEKSAQADIWINTGNASSKQEVIQTDGRLGTLRPFKLDALFNNNARQNAYGGNDYWESGLVNPQLILKDLICIFHPELMKEKKLTYYKKL